MTKVSTKVDQDTEPSVKSASIKCVNIESGLNVSGNGSRLGEKSVVGLTRGIST